MRPSLALVGILLAAGCGTPRFRGMDLPLALPPIVAPAPLPPGATPPEVVHRTTMVLPQVWMLRDLVARVRLRVAIDAEGDPHQAMTVAVDAPSDIRDHLGRIAVQTVGGWKFRPGQIDGRAVPAWAEVDLAVDLVEWWAAVHSAPDVPEVPPGFTRPKRIGGVRLVWPRGKPPRLQGRQSAVVVIEVRPDGTSGAVWIARSSGERSFELALLEGLRHQRFEPASGPDGQPLPALYRMRFDINL